jgi:hypothetical protein
VSQPITAKQKAPRKFQNIFDDLPVFPTPPAHPKTILECLDQFTNRSLVLLATIDNPAINQTLSGRGFDRESTEEDRGPDMTALVSFQQ